MVSLYLKPTAGAGRFTHLLALRRVQPFWKVRRSERAQRRHGYCQRPKGSQLHSHLWRILRPARVHQPRWHIWDHERAASKCHWKGCFDIIVRSSLHELKLINDLFPNCVATSKPTTLSGRSLVSVKASTFQLETDSLHSIFGLATFPTRTESSWTLTHTSPLTEVPTPRQFQTSDQTETMEVFGRSRRVPAGLPGCSRGMSAFTLKPLYRRAQSLTPTHHLVKQRLVSTLPESSAFRPMTVGSGLRERRQPL